MKASLYIRVRIDGKYVTTRPAYTDTGRIRPQTAMIDGKPERFDTAAYLLRYVRDGKPTWETIGQDANLALAALARKNHALTGARLGIALPVASTGLAAVESAAASNGSGRSLAAAVTEYLDEIRLSKKPKTLAAYTVSLAYFQESCDKAYLEDIDRKDMLQFTAFLRDKKEQSARSSWNKFSNVMSFLKTNNIRNIVKTGDWPVYTEEKPEIYEVDDLNTFFAACDADERLWFEFFLFTGMREQEVMYCTWRDVNFKKRIVSVTAKAEYGWTPKAYREREIPVPASLMDRLSAIRPTNGKGLIFATSGDQPKLDFLDCLKTVAERAGLDPADFWLHKFRATFATMHLQGGVDLRTVQEWLGHKDLESTMRYLKPAEGEKAQAMVNQTFVGIGRGAA